MPKASNEQSGTRDEAVFRIARADLLWLASIALAVFLVFGRSSGFGLTGWDDLVFIADNPVLDLPLLDGVRQVFRPGAIPEEMLYIPVTYLSHLFEVQLFGRDPGVMHVTNVALHLVNAGLVWLLLRQLLRRRALAFLGALAFAVHPLQAESVAWLMGRKELLSALFGLVATLAYLRFLGGGRRYYALALVAFAIGVLAKPSLIVLPALLLILDYRADGRWTLRWKAKLPFLLIALVAVSAHFSLPAPDRGSMPPLGFRLLCVPWLIWHWAGSLLLLRAPAPLHVWPARSDWVVVALQGLPLLLAAAALFVVAVRRRWNGLWQGMLAVALLFLPSAGIVLGYRSFFTADRYAYLPLVAVCALAAALPFGSMARPNRPALVAVLLWIAACFVLAPPAVSTWEDDFSVWNRMLAVDPDQVYARVNRGNTFAKRGRAVEAVADFQHALRVDPESVLASSNLAILHLRSGRPELAIAVLLKAHSLAPREPVFPTLLGDAFRGLRKAPEAAKWYGVAHDLVPDDAYVAERLAEARSALRR